MKVEPTLTLSFHSYISIHVGQGFYIYLVAPKGAVCLWVKAYLSFGFLLGLLGQKYSLDVGKNTSLCDGDAGEQFVQLLVITDSQHDAAKWNLSWKQVWNINLSSENAFSSYPQARRSWQTSEFNGSGWFPRALAFKYHTLTCKGWRNIENVSLQLAYTTDLDQIERRSTKVFTRPSQNSVHVKRSAFMTSNRISSQLTLSLSYSPLSRLSSLLQLFIVNIGTQGVQESFV